MEKAPCRGLRGLLSVNNKATQRVASLCSLSRCARRADHDRDLHPEVIGVDVEDELDVSRKLISPFQVATLSVSCDEGLEDGDCDRKECHVFVAVTAKTPPARSRYLRGFCARNHVSRQKASCRAPSGIVDIGTHRRQELTPDLGKGPRISENCALCHGIALLAYSVLQVASRPV